LAEVIVYTTAVCPYCVNAKRLLTEKGVPFKEVRVDLDPALRQEVMARSRQRTVPQIWIGEVHVGGFTDLWALEKSGKLDQLLNA
jgi:glutaredoxin 3